MYVTFTKANTCEHLSFLNSAVTRVKRKQVKVVQILFRNFLKDKKCKTMNTDVPVIIKDDFIGQRQYCVKSYKYYVFLT